jgi:small GTP-binding protein
MNNEQKQISVKIVILGGNLTGKTNFTFHFINHDFIQQYFESKSVQFYTKSINCLNKNLKLDIWDTVGNVRFRHLNKIFYKNANICLILFDLTNLDSLNDVDYYYNEIKIHNYKNCCIILVGNKCDDIENRKIFKKDIKQLKEKYKIPYFEISCKNGRNIKELEYFICRSYIQNTINDDIEDNQYDIQYNQNFKIKKPSNRVKNICFIF